MPQSVVQKFSRHAGEVDKLAAELGVGSAPGKDKLGATSRQFKRKDMTLADYRKYWDSRVSPDEARQVAEVIKAAILKENPAPTNTADKVVQYAIAHVFERKSVMDWHDLAITAMERSMGGARPEQIEPEAIKQGVLLKDGQATTKQVLAEESRIIDFAREGKGMMRPLGMGSTALSDPASPSSSRTNPATPPTLGQQKGRPDESKRPLRTEFAHDNATLSPEQQALFQHIMSSTDQVNLVVADAGAGKTTTAKPLVAAITRETGLPVEIMAPSAAASRDVLRSEGFTAADTLTSFLNSPQRQTAVKNGLILLDEAGQAPIRDLDRLCEIAREQSARLVLMGDPKQHASPARHGNMMNVLQECADLPVGRLQEIWRQKHKGYKAVVADTAEGKRDRAFDALAKLGWVQKVDGHAPLVDEYMRGLSKEQLVIAPTHAEADAVTAAIRKRLQDDGKLGTEERLVEQLVPLNRTEAERNDLGRYDGTEVLKFHRNSGTFKAGQTVRVADWKPGDRWKGASHFSVHRKEELGLVAGDLVRFTANGRTMDGHDLNNGSVYRLKGFDKHDNLILENGWTVKKDFGCLTHGYVSTSHAAQGKTVDRVLIAMGSESKGAISAEQFYVSVSRARESAKIFTDMPPEELKQAIQRTDTRRSATELLQPKPKKKSRRKRFIERLKAGYDLLRERIERVIPERKQPEKEMTHER